MQHTFFSAEPCLLCCLDFPTPSGRDAWNYDFRAALFFNPERDTSVKITKVATWDSGPNAVNDETFTTFADNGRPRKIGLSRNPLICRSRPPEGRGFFFHDWCYNVLKWGIKGHPKSTLSKLVACLALKSPTTQYHDRIDPGTCHKTFLSHAEHFSPQPLSMSKLPPELRRQIWEYVGSTTAYSAFIMVTSEAVRLASSLQYSPKHEIRLNQGLCLSVEMISIYGHEYIRKFNTSEAPNGSSNILGVVTRLQYAASLNGICAVKVLGTDWRTDWIGKIPNAGCIWYGTECGVAPTFDFIYNALNCVGISTKKSPPRNQILWDQSRIPRSLHDSDTRLYDFDLKDFVSLRADPLAKGPRAVRYVPFYNGTEYIKELTTYVTRNGIIGFEVRFTGYSQMAGSREGTPLHFRLDKGERIAYAWLGCTNSLEFVAAAIAIKTSFGRSELFEISQVHGVPFPRPSVLYKWTRLQEKEDIPGFFFEIPRGLLIRRFGLYSC